MPLFNGMDLKGCKTLADSKGKWSVEGSELVGRGKYVLFSERENYRDFHHGTEAKFVKGGGYWPAPSRSCLAKSARKRRRSRLGTAFSDTPVSDSSAQNGGHAASNSPGCRCPPSR